MTGTMVATPSQERRRELGAFLRAQREKLAPAALGLVPVGRRRTPGLRREEVAQLGGLSTTWYTWIEQARDVSISPAALARLANALHLGRAERVYLFELAGKRDPESDAGTPAVIPPAALACVAAIRTPAYILDRLWTARTWNKPAERLFAGWLDRPGNRNLLRFIFLAPEARKLICGWDERARRVVAEFRADSLPHAGDAALRDLIAELRRNSREFARLWGQHGVLEREGGERSFNHPRDGFLRYQQVTFDLASQPGLKLTMLVGPIRLVPKRRGSRRKPR